ncbi:hypothetical protein GOODEAATRI_001653 [Goodea atripinnis]|uniref:Uncharacterized protein n=1 Tax=Goodea atripinnis TaxID=208336 RepID=A0ABV0ME84_9TELE
MPLTHPTHLLSSAQHSWLGVRRTRGLYCACSQAPGQQGHLVPKQTLPLLELLALHVCVSMCVSVCVCACMLKGDQYLSVRMHHQNEGRGLALEEHLSNFSAGHIRTHSVQPVGDRGSKNIIERARAASQVKLFSLNIYT